ncbi:MAG: hypothetical protein ABSH22_10705, partial [Tepidisphaeraceae bacterium]
GADAADGYNGSFLSYVDSLFPGTTDPALLSAADWTLIDGAWGVDPSADIAWGVNDNTSADYAVVGLFGPALTPLPSSLVGGLALMLGLGYVTWRKTRRAA